MRYLLLGSSLRGLADVATTVMAEGHELVLFDAEQPGIPEGVRSDGVDVLPTDWDARFLDGVDRIVTSPWFPETAPPLSDALAAGVEVITEAGFGLERIGTPRIAVTGTNGKTTVTEVTTAMLVASGVRAIAAGNIGAPVSSLDTGDADVLVLELSSYQLRFLGTTLDPLAATILNIAPDHLDWHGSMEAYAEAKASIVADSRPEAVFAYDDEDDLVRSIASRAVARSVPCSGTVVPEGGNGVEGDHLVVDGHRFTTSVTSATYRFDLVVAATLALAGGATVEGVASVTEEFHPGRHRRETVGVVDGVVYVNDSKATNPHATIAAVSAYDSVILMVGGRNKGLDLAPVADLEVKQMVAFGESGPDIAASSRSPVAVAHGLRGAFSEAVAVAEPGDTVLLSPACASFDEFDSYEQRGDVFRDLVHSLEGASP